MIIISSDLSFWFWLLFPFPFGHLQELSKAGPYDLDIHHMEECPNIGRGKARFYFKMKRISRSRLVMDVNATSLESFDDSFTMESNVAQFTNGGWKENYFKKSFPKLCFTVKSLFPKYLKVMHKHSGLPKGYPKCPFPVRNWTITNLPLDVDTDFVPVFFYNKYRLDISITKNSNLYGCMSVFYDVIPKKSKSKKKPTA